ncbi:hypothetical protein ACFX19_002709 [Malus domestica]
MAWHYRARIPDLSESLSLCPYEDSSTRESFFFSITTVYLFKITLNTQSISTKWENPILMKRFSATMMLYSDDQTWISSVAHIFSMIDSSSFISVTCHHALRRYYSLHLQLHSG